MRLMVLSLQRIGDWLQTENLLLKYLQEKQIAKKDVHLVLQSSSRALNGILPFSTVSYFPREVLARELVELHGAPGEAETQLRSWLEKVIEWGPTHFVDLAPNKTSQALVALLRAQGVQSVPLNPTYLNFLNETWVGNDAPVMTWTDVLGGLLGQGPAAKVEDHSRTTSRVCLQLTTSDVQKDWPLDHWLKLARLLSSQGYEVQALVAPFEEKRILAHDHGFKDYLKVCSFSEASTLLRNSSLLISGDTAMAHLSAITETPLICLFQGPANPKKLLPSLIDSWIVQGEIEPFQVFRLAQSKLHNEKLIVDDEFTVSIVRQGSGGRLLLKDQPALQGGRVRLRSDVQLTSAQRIALDQVVWGFYLDEKYEEVIPPYGSAVHELFQIESFLPSDAYTLKACLGRLDSAEDFLQILNEKYLGFCRHGHESDIKRMRTLSEISDVAASLPLQGFVTDASRKFLLALQEARSESDFFKAARGLKEGISEIFLLLQIQRKLMLGLINKIEERSHRVSRAREISTASPR